MPLPLLSDFGAIVKIAVLYIKNEVYYMKFHILMLLLLINYRFNICCNKHLDKSSADTQHRSEAKGRIQVRMLQY